MTLLAITDIGGGTHALGYKEGAMISTDDMREAAKWEGVTDPLGAAVLDRIVAALRAIETWLREGGTP